MLNKKLHLIYRSVLSQTKEIGSELLLKGRSEKVLFLLLFVFYLSYSLFYAFETSLVAHFSRSYDLYFSFDNVITFLRGYSNTGRHPFFQVFSFPLTFVGNALTKYCGMGYRILLFVSICSFFIAMSNIYIFRYLKEIVKLKNKESILIVLFYSLFSTNIILAFTTDSYTISLFLLSFFVLFFSRKIESQKPIQLFSYMLSIIAIGGITVTNGLKFGGVVFFLKGTMKRKLRIIFITACTFLFLVLLTGYDFVYWFTQNKFLLEDEGAVYGYWDKLGFFFGMPILLGELCMTNAPFSSHPMIFYQPYEYIWQFLFVGLILGLIVFSFIRNYRQRLMQYLLFLFSFDVFIHVVLSFGLHEAMIYGAHWIYLVPLLIGWVLKNSDGMKKRSLIVLLCCMLVVLVGNNMVQMIDFTRLAHEYFPKEDSLLFMPIKR